MHQGNLAIYLRPRVLERSKRYAAIDIQVTETCSRMREVLERHPDVARKRTAAVRAAGLDVVHRDHPWGVQTLHSRASWDCPHPTFSPAACYSAAAKNGSR